MNNSNSEDLKRAIAASKINWETVGKWRDRLEYKSNDEMLFDWMFDRDEVYKRGLFKRPNPFHKHVRNLLDNMEHLGLSSIDMVIEQGLKLTKKEIEDYKDSIEDNEEQDDE